MFFSKALQMDETLGNIAGSGGIDWNAIINQGFALGSQMVNSWGGQNTGTQIGYNASQGGVFAIAPARPSYDDSYRYTATAQPAGQTGGVGGTVGSGVDGIFNWLMSNPLITFGGIAGLYLLFREPPRRR